MEVRRWLTAQMRPSGSGVTDVIYASARLRQSFRLDMSMVLGEETPASDPADGEGSCHSGTTFVGNFSVRDLPGTYFSVET